MRTCGLLFGQRTYLVAHDAGSDINRIVGSPEIGRNIEERVETWRSAAKIATVSVRRHPHRLNLKLVRD
jgi:hypothetical protein